MIFLDKHYRIALPGKCHHASDRPEAAPRRHLSIDAVGAPHDRKIGGRFDYYFPDADDGPADLQTATAVSALADAMSEKAPEPSRDTEIPPVYTFLGQFIRHDIEAMFAREPELSNVSSAQTVPLSRDRVVQSLCNYRRGLLNLDSLYGSDPMDDELTQRLTDLLRNPWDRAGLWAGTLYDAGFDFLPLQRDAIEDRNDTSWDLIRLGRLVGEDEPFLTADELRAFPPELAETFLNSDGTVRIQRALIGDGRNDGNLALAQLHLAFVRFHNEAVREANLYGLATGEHDIVFHWARKMAIWHFQWLVLYDYLPTVCDPRTVTDVISRGAPLYSDFVARIGSTAPYAMPLPLEFSAAAFPFVHSTFRPEYDWNARFGRAAGSEQHLSDRASHEQLLALTGAAANPMMLSDRTNAPRLPGHWSADWSRLALPVDQGFADRSALGISTTLAVPTFAFQPGLTGVVRHVLQPALLRGHQLNIPSAQDCLAGIEQILGGRLPRLSPTELTAGPTSNEMQSAGLADRTPLMFYVLKEAETLGEAGRLGPLGSRLVAETLAGLILHDPSSFWNAEDHVSDKRHWHPTDGLRPNGCTVDTIANFLRAARML